MCVTERKNLSRAAFTWLIAIVFVLALASAAQAQRANRSVKPEALGLGTANGTSVACNGKGITGGICYSVALTCPNVPDNTAIVKVLSPSSTPVGTVVMTGGGGASAFYEFAPVYGSYVVSSVVAAGYTVAEIQFPTPGGNGWFTGPAADGPLALACLYSTLVEWVYTNIHLANTGAPFCGHGESGGAAAVGYSLAQYGLGSIYNMVELISGPPFGRIDYGCLCTGTAPKSPCGTFNRNCFNPGSTAQLLTDAAYGNKNCANQVASDATLWENDSVAAPDANYTYSNTDVHFVFGGKDLSSAVPQGLLFANQIQTQKVISCVADAGHDMTAVLDGANQIISDLSTYCKLPANYAAREKSLNNKALSVLMK